MNDLSALRPSEITYDVTHPGTGKKLGVTVSLVSMDDERMRKIKRRIQDEGLKAQQRGKPITSQKLEDDTNQIIFTAMTGWVWGKPEPIDADDKPEDASFEGEKPPFNEANVIKILKALPWFREQLNEAIGDTKSFFQA